MTDDMSFNVRVVRKVSLPGYESLDVSATLSDVPVLTSESGIRDLAARAVNAVEILRAELEQKALAIKRDLGGSPVRPPAPATPPAGLAGAFESKSPAPAVPSPGGLRQFTAFGHSVPAPEPWMFEEVITPPQIKKIAAMLGHGKCAHWQICQTILRGMGLDCHITSKLNLSKGQASLVIDWYESASGEAKGEMFKTAVTA